MSLKDFMGSDVGQTILAAAQGIVTNAQTAQQLLAQRQRMDQEVKQQSRVLELQKRELDIRERTVSVQEQQLLQRNAPPDPLHVAQQMATLRKTEAEADKISKQTDLLGVPGSGDGSISPRNVEFIRSMAVTRLAQSRMQGLVEKYNGTATTPIPSGVYSPKDAVDMRFKLERALTDIDPLALQMLSDKGDKSSALELARVTRMRQQLSALTQLMDQREFQDLAFQEQRGTFDPGEILATAESLFPGSGSALTARSPVQMPPQLQVAEMFGTIPPDFLASSVRMAVDGNTTNLKNVLAHTLRDRANDPQFLANVSGWLRSQGVADPLPAMREVLEALNRGPTQ